MQQHHALTTHAWQALGGTIVLSNGRRVFAVDVGDRGASADKTVILIHGFPESSFSYSYALPYLKARFARIVTWDSLGFGFSDKPNQGFSYSLFEHTDVSLEVLRQLGVQGGHIVSHDMGDTIHTEILVRLHANRPYWFTDGIQSCTFTNGGMVMRHTHFRVAQRVLLSPAKGLVTPLLFENYPFFRLQVLSAHGNKSLPEERIRALFEQFFLNSNPTIVWKVVQYYKERYRFESIRWLPILGQLNVPLHIAWGVDDQNNVVASADYIKTHIAPQAKVTRMHGLGHFCQIQAPQAWTQHILVGIP